MPHLNKRTLALLLILGVATIVGINMYGLIPDPKPRGYHETTLDGTRLMHSDCRTCSYVEGSTAYILVGERNAIYVNQRHLTDEVAHFSMISDPGAKYEVARDSTHVYSLGLTLAGADPETFRTLSGSVRYGMDNSQVYDLSTGAVIYEADPTTFRLSATTSESEHFAQDKEHVYIGGALLEGADVASFQPVSTDLYCITCMIGFDANAIFLPQKTVPFRTDTRNILRDGLNLSEKVYVRIEDAIYPTTLDFVAKHAEWEQKLLEQDKKIEQADAETFMPLPQGYARDARQVFFLDTPLPKADSATFAVLANDFARDKDHVYKYGKEVSPVNMDTFEILGDRYVRDQYRVQACTAQFYYEGLDLDPQTWSCAVLPAIHSDTFRLLGYANLAWFATDNVRVIQDATDFAAYERDGRGDLSLSIEARTRIVATPGSPFMNTVRPVPDSNYVLFNNALWYTSPLLRSPGSGSDWDTNSRSRIRTYEIPFVLTYLTEVPNENNMGSYRCDYLHVDNIWYFTGTMIEVADPETFEVLGTHLCNYAKDKDKVYFRTQVITEAQAETFRVYDQAEQFATDDCADYEHYSRYPLGYYAQLLGD